MPLDWQNLDFDGSGGGGGGGISEAPMDGQQYGRQGGSWTVVSGGGGITEAPVDGSIYGRKSRAWTRVVSFPEAPADGKQYARQSGAWAEVSGGGGDSAIKLIQHVPPMLVEEIGETEIVGVPVPLSVYSSGTLIFDMHYTVTLSAAVTIRLMLDSTQIGTATLSTSYKSGSLRYQVYMDGSSLVVPTSPSTPYGLTATQPITYTGRTEGSYLSWVLNAPASVTVSFSLFGGNVFYMGE